MATSGSTRSRTGDTGWLPALRTSRNPRRALRCGRWRRCRVWHGARVCSAWGQGSTPGLFQRGGNLETQQGRGLGTEPAQLFLRRVECHPPQTSLVIERASLILLVRSPVCHAEIEQDEAVTVVV